MNFRRSKSRVTDYRPAGKRSDSFERSDRASKQEAANHDAWAAGLSRETVVLAAGDLCKARAHDRKNPEHRWIMGRKAALLRRIHNEKLIPTSKP